MAQSATRAVETHHEDMIHDAQLDYYSRRLATASSDGTIKLFDVEGDSQRLIETLTGHDAPVWQVSWAHPKFGNILASCSYDGRVFIWKEQNTTWTKIKEHTIHIASVNAVSWAPHELGPILACSSSDGKVSVLEYRDDGSWEIFVIDAHGIGCNAVSWAPAASADSLIHANDRNANAVKKLATAGCDNLIKIWIWSDDVRSWQEKQTLDGHSDWVRDVVWAPNVGLPKSYLASCSQDKSVLIWTQDTPGSKWVKTTLSGDKFPDVVWRVSWSLSANVLAVSCGDNKVTLWKEDDKGGWNCVEAFEENA